MKQLILGATIALGAMSLSACSTMSAMPSTPVMAAPSALSSPEPIEDNSGSFMSPYTSDEVIAEWVDNALKAKAGAATGAAMGSALGQYAASEALEGFGMFGSLIGKSIGKKMGRDQALKAAGGMEVIKKTSDLSFNRWEDLAVFMYVNYSSNEDYAEVLAATQAIYPELNNYSSAIGTASRSVQ